MSESKSIRLSEAKTYVKAHFGLHQPVMLWGSPGIGKSAIVKEIGADYQEAGMKALLIDIRLSLMDPTDIKGIPFFNPDSQRMEWAPPIELPTPESADDYDIIILFLDEINGAPQLVQGATYQLVLDRRVGTYALPKNVYMCAAGNQESDKGVTFQMPTPLANRMVHYVVECNFDDWQAWAIKHKIHPDVVGYLTYRKQDLMDFNPKSAIAEKSFPTPRTWEYVGNILGIADRFAESQVSDMVGGAIGQRTGIQFMAYRKVSSGLPDPTDILTGKVKKVKLEEISALYSLATSIGYELREVQNEVNDNRVEESTLMNYVDNAIGFWMDHFNPEMLIMSFQMVLQFLEPDIQECKNWAKAYDEYSDIIRAA